MFLENYNLNTNKGWIEVIVGSMFSGKTEELIRRIKRAKIAKQQVEIFKPLIDTRYSKDNVVSHNANNIPARAIAKPEMIYDYIAKAEVIGIDEAQFFDKEIVTVCNNLANNGIRVIAAGLDMDFKGKPFGSIPEIMSIAEYVTKVHAICVNCGELANYSHRLTNNEDLIELGEKEKYEALCRICYNKKNL